jgi:hypothetical protein
MYEPNDALKDRPAVGGGGGEAAVRSIVILLFNKNQLRQ